MRIKLLLLIFSITSTTFSQVKLYGTITDHQTGQPISFATIFINGTTLGTITGDDGYFEIQNVVPPAQVIISHVSYKPQKIQFQIGDTAKRTIQLDASKVNLPEFTVQNKNLREQNVKEFTQSFIGRDKWGEDAKLENDSILHFKHIYKYDTLPACDSTLTFIKFNSNSEIYEWSKDSSFIITRQLDEFDVSASAPLLIDMPRLGYKVHIDLINFKLTHYGSLNRITFLGFYYYQPYATLNKWKQKGIENNREMVYYNSRQHFLRALFNNQLAENGYKLYCTQKDSDSQKYEPAIIDSCFISVDTTQLKIIGLKNQKYIIDYFSGYTNKPLDLTRSKNSAYNQKSEIIFLKDTCVLYSDGIIGDNSMMFGGTISDKLVGASLPGNYTPPTKKEPKQKEKSQ